MHLRHVTLGLLFILGTSSRAFAAPSVALLPLVGQGLGTDEIARVEKTLQTEVDARFGSRSVPKSDVRARLETGSASGLHCDRSEIDCLVQLGIVVRSDQLILATLANKGAAIQLALRLVDVNEATQLAYAAGPATAEPTSAEVRALLDALDQAPSRATSVTFVGAPGALVVIDGKNAGTLPLAPLTDVAPGKHIVAIIGALRHDANIEVRRGEPITVEAPMPGPMVKLAPGIGTPAAPQTADKTNAVEIKPVEPPKMHQPSVVPWIGVAGGGVGVVAGGLALVAGLSPKLSYDADAARLRAIENDVGTDKSALDARAGEVQEARRSLDQHAADWTSWGAPTAVAGVVVVAVGAGALVAGLLTVDD